MHESSLIPDLLRKVEAVARDAGGARVVAVTVSIGPFSGISAGHLREHFVDAARGTIADGARLHVEEMPPELGHAQAQHVLLASVEVEEVGGSA
jgi:hydrogenase nickel incorporation protein HypA/HybF